MNGPGSAPIEVGAVLFGKYRVERILGLGGMGVVVSARHLALGELFAIKFMVPTALSSGEAVERFLREARAAARLRSEHVAKVYDVGMLEDGAPYMVMEHLSGSDLKDVAKLGPMPALVAIDYVLQACDALAEAHSLGIIHRDLKPANLFLTTRPNGTPCIKVLDFGISKQTGPDASEQLEMTKTAAVLGSPLYMSPEQMLSTKTADARTDVWALGVILYRFISGAVPFPGSTLTEVCARVFQEQPAPLVPRVPGVTQALQTVIMRCLEKDAARRFPTAGALAAALHLATASDGLEPTMALGARELPSETITIPRFAPAISGTSAPLVMSAAPVKPRSSMGVVSLAAIGVVAVIAVIGVGASRLLPHSGGKAPTVIPLEAASASATASEPGSAPAATTSASEAALVSPSAFPSAATPAAQVASSGAPVTGAPAGSGHPSASGTKPANTSRIRR